MFKQKYIPKCNKNIEISATGGSLSVDGGLPVIKDFMDQSNFSDLFNQIVQFKDSRPRVLHPSKSILEQLIILKILGYDTDDSADSLSQNQLFTNTLGVSSLASQPTISRAFHRVTADVLDQLFEVNKRYIAQYYKEQKDYNQPVLIDLDSTHFDTYGNQEENAFNQHYQTFGYHPLVAFDGINGLFLGAKLRIGNQYSSTGVVEFLRPILTYFITYLHLNNLYIRADSGFAVPELYDLCEELGVRYIIRLKSNSRLDQLSEQLDTKKSLFSATGTEYVYSKTSYQAYSWKKKRAVIIQREHPVNELFSHSMFVVTNMQEMTDQTIIRLYKGRGQMENYIKEAKLGFFIDKTDSSQFLINETRMALGMLSYNIIQMMKLMVLPDKMKKWSVGTIRQKLIKVAVRIVKHAKRIQFKLDETFVYVQDYFSCCNKLDKFSL